MNSEQCGTITTIIIIITILSTTAIMITGIFGASKIQNVNA